MPPPLVEFRFLHIAKCGGHTIGDLFKHGVASGQLPSQHDLGFTTADPDDLGIGLAEGCLRMVPMQPRNPSHAHMRSTTLRSPRSHLLSMYLQCHTWREGPAPYLDEFPKAVDSSGPLDESAAADALHRWLRYFDPHKWRHADAVRQRSGQHNDFNCYNPLSMQTRALTCGLGRNTSQHHVLGDEPPTTHYPSVAAALAGLGTMDHVGLIELFAESWCLLLWRAGATPLPASCDCRVRAQAQQARQQQVGAQQDHEQDGTADELATRSNSRTDDVHHPDRAILPRLTVAGLPADVLATMDRLTPADRAVYRVAAVRVVRDLLDAGADSGVTLLCPAALEALVNETRYIPGLEKELHQLQEGQ